MNKLSTERRVRVIAALVEGNSIRSTVRMTGVAKNTVIKLLIDVGTACGRYQDSVMHKLSCKHLQVDEIWSFCYSKEKNIPAEKRGRFGYGDVWTWTAICAESKLVPCWKVGTRDAHAATTFLKGLASRLAHRIQLTSDGHKAYLEAVESAFGNQIDYAQLVKLYDVERIEETQRYSPAKCLGATSRVVFGVPDLQYVSTSYAERQNLNMRMGMRRFTRLTNAFSKKVQNLKHAVALHFMHYNFVRVHQTLRTTPAMAAGVAKHRWTLEEIVGLLNEQLSN